jgi:hypothetical protein
MNKHSAVREGNFQEVESVSWIYQNYVNWSKVQLLQNWWILKWDSPQLLLISYLVMYVGYGGSLPSKLSTGRNKNELRREVGQNIPILNLLNLSSLCLEHQHLKDVCSQLWPMSVYLTEIELMRSQFEPYSPANSTSVWNERRFIAK